MQKIKTTRLLISTLLVMGLAGEVAVAQDRLVTGSTVGKYRKPGAPIDMTYKTNRVGLGEIADVNITLTTGINSGIMSVALNFDENLKTEGIVYDNIEFSLSPNTKEYNINIQVSSAKDGLYYVRLLTKIDGRMRALAVPIYVGSGKLKSKSGQVVMKAKGGENISVSKAEETIETID